MGYNGAMRSLGFLVRLFRNPVEGVLWIFSTGLFLYSCYFLSPVYEATYGTIIPAAGLQRGVELALGLFLLLASLPGVVAPFIRKVRRARSLKLGTFSVFLAFLFLTILRIAIFGLVPASWIPMLLICLASAYLHIWLKVRKE